MVKLQWTAESEVQIDTNGLYARTISGNSAFDPDPGVSARQPTGFDQYTALYRFYYVAGSKCLVELINTGTTEVVEFGVFPATNQISTTDLATMEPADWPYATTKTLGPLASSFSRARFRKYMSTKKIYGYKTSNNDNFVASISASPTNQWWWNFYAVNFTAAEATLRIRIRVIYYCHFFGRQEIAFS